MRTDAGPGAGLARDRRLGPLLDDAPAEAHPALPAAQTRNAHIAPLGDKLGYRRADGRSHRAVAAGAAHTSLTAWRGLSVTPDSPGERGNVRRYPPETRILIVTFTQSACASTNVATSACATILDPE